jgi:hypothetical protein
MVAFEEAENGSDLPLVMRALQETVVVAPNKTIEPTR